MRVGLRAFAAALLVFFMAVPSQAETVKVGITKLLGYPGVPIGVARGYFKAVGLDVEMVYFDSAQPIAVGVASGGIDFGVCGLSASFYTLASQGELKLIASSGGEHPGFHNLVFLASPKSFDAGVTSPQDLRGRSVAITQLGTSLEYALGRAAEKFGYPMSAVTLRPLQSNTNVMAALAGNQVDAAVMPGSPALPGIEKGAAKLIGWASDVAPDFTTGSALVTRTATANDKADLVKRFLVAYRHGMLDFHNAFVSADGTPTAGPDQPNVLKIMSDFTHIAPDQLLKVVPYVDGEGRISTADIARQMAWYRSQNLLRGDAKAEALIDSRYALPLVASR
ncbi:MAG TPA: ABC transporter substrate-binding protein [Stellaceae bacterium]|nr:ABC transporter substrate-binding protein [Stellaceae bacterium]